MLGNAIQQQFGARADRRQLARTPRPLPQLAIRRQTTSLFDLQFDDFALTAYDPYPAIRAPVAV